MLVELEPGDDHDRPRVRRRAPTSSRSTSDVAHADHRTRAARRAAADARRPDRAQPRDRARTKRACSTTYGVEMIGASVEAIRTAEDRAAVQARDDRDRPAVPPSGIALHARRGARASRARSATRSSSGPRTSSAAAAPASRTTPTRCARDRRSAASPRARSREILIERSRSSGWKEYELEVMRDHADNVRRHLLDREPRPDGRAHRRVDHRRARADAHRRRVPAHARRRVRVHPPHRRRDRRSNVQFAVDPHERRAWSSSR